MNQETDRFSLPAKVFNLLSIRERGIATTASGCSISTLSHRDRIEIADILLGLLCKHGLDKHDEPNEIGLEIEQAIGQLQTGVEGPITGVASQLCRRVGGDGGRER